MAINWTFYIKGIYPDEAPGFAGWPVDEPQGWAGVVLNINRDSEWHGIFIEAATSTLMFYGTGADLLRTKKNSQGLASTAQFIAKADCGTSVDILTGNFDFGTYNEKKGTSCGVEIAIEKTGCVMTMRNRYDQKVDLSKATSFNNLTLLEDYPGLNTGIELLAQKISIGNEAQMGDAAITEVLSDNPNWSDSTGFDVYRGYVAPAFPIVTNESFGTFNPAYFIELADPLVSAPNRPPFPDFPTTTGTATLVGGIACGLEDTVLQYRMKGSAQLTLSGSGGVGMTVKIFRLPAGLDGGLAVNWIQVHAQALFNMTTSSTVTFDFNNTVPLTINQGDFIFFGIYTEATNLLHIDNFTFTEDVNSFYKLTSSATCEPTDAITSLINETGSRIIESVTDVCMRMKSDYYGRTDSKPYASPADGCGGLRVLTNGLKIRQATPSNHFISLEDFFLGLRGIDNIGMGVESDTVLGGELVRIEPVQYFYQDIRLMQLPFIPQADAPLDATKGYSNIRIGYQKWEVERVNGLDEFNSNKEFRTSLSTINNQLDATSPFVAGGYPIEVTRQQSFAESGAADTKYDNETFIICVDRNAVYRVTFFASGNHMTFETPGDGSSFIGPTTITIAGSASNDGTRNILSVAVTNLPGNRSSIDITFTGGATIDEFADAVTFTGIVAGGFFVEKGNIDNPANIFSPDTRYNWRIRPMYNLMRWFKSIAQTYVVLTNSISKLFFTSGTGNYVATGELPAGDACKLEAGILPENHDLAFADFADPVDATPLYRPELMQFNYPLSIKDYLLIKANPYGYLEVQFGNGTFEKGFIKSIAYKPVEGNATFTLIKKWQ